MLLIKTYLSLLPKKGISLFAGEDLKPGQIFHIEEQVIDKKISGNIARRMPNYHFIRKYAVYNREKDEYYLSGDDERFMNHSEYPNCVYIDTLGIIREYILKGTELTCDYRTVCDHRLQEGLEF
ncbi:MAG: SET domain-containing protein-lysine N-methyltransferase [Bacteroidales bacterium]|nr:SET domain-containing protein-lysine N-methyltransferase [Bacteroidales bacterium]